MVARVSARAQGLDDGWQLCNLHVTPANPHAFHTPLGAPIVDTAIFPDLAAMNALAHSLNLTSGWYGNNCNVRPCAHRGPLNIPQPQGCSHANVQSNVQPALR